ncbi:hypothetical protein ABTY20_34935, partial [Streptomyces sp. NPDC126497]
MTAVVERLRDRVGAAVHLSRYVDGEVTVARYAGGPAAPEVDERVGLRHRAHATAVGRSCSPGSARLRPRRSPGPTACAGPP